FRGLPRAQAERAVGEGHQHAALDDTEQVRVLRMGDEAVARPVRVAPFPDRADVLDESFVGVGRPAFTLGVDELHGILYTPSTLSKQKSSIASSGAGSRSRRLRSAAPSQQSTSRLAISRGFAFAET